MTETIFIAIVAATASLLTFFSGFGLGTILTPFFVLFFPVETAIALTGIVHLFNNFFKIILVRKNISWNVGLRFGIAGIIGAFAGAELLFLFSEIPAIFVYTIADKTYSVTILKLIIAALMVVFALFEIVPRLKKIQFQKNILIPGGFVSGFFGGLSGNQGALRSAFLLKCGLSKEGFIATGILIACMVDLTRLSVYFTRMSGISIMDNIILLVSAVISAFAGAFIGSRLLKKVTMGFVQNVVTVLIIVIALLLGAGLI